MGNTVGRRRRLRSLGVTGIVLATLASPATARADDVLSEASDPVDALFAEVEAAAAAVTVTVPVEDLAEAPEEGPAAPEPAVEPPVQAAPEPAVAPEPAPEPAQAPTQAPEPQTAPDITQYQAPAAPTQPAAAPEPQPDAAAPTSAPVADARETAPTSWTWIWNWDCEQPVQMPVPTSGSWTWIWNWDCEHPDAGAAAPSPGDPTQYQPQPDRYQPENAAQILPSNMNVAIRIFSPGDDGPVSQVNSAISQTTTYVTNIVNQVVNQVVHTTLPAPVMPAPAPAPGAPSAGSPSFLDELIAEVVAPASELTLGLPVSIVVLGGDAPQAPALRPGQLPATAASGLTPGYPVTTTATQLSSPSTHRLESRGSAPQVRDDPSRIRPEPAALALSLPPGAAAGAASASAGGAGGAAAVGFMLALMLAYLVIPPGITTRVRVAGARTPTGVVLEGPDPPG